MMKALTILCDIGIVIALVFVGLPLSRGDVPLVYHALPFLVGFVAGHFVLRMMSSGIKRTKGAAPRGSKVDFSSIPSDDPGAPEQVGRLLLARANTKSVDVIDLVDDILYAADYLQASDVHLEPKETELRLACRIDGTMVNIVSFPRELESRLANRFRIMSKLDFTRLDEPQDGRVQEKIYGKAMNLRVSIFPVLNGSKVVVRLLDSGTHALPPLEALGIQPAVLADFRRVIHAPQGLILFTGPTGSGKSTLMYTALREVAGAKGVRRNIVTLEDPIERILDELNQTQVDLRRGLTFATGLRTLLRQDPDLIMVGEIRDMETAEIALRAGQTGHSIMSTLHTSSASAAFVRLMDMGLEPFLLVSAISGVVGSRLVRRLCPHCRVKKAPSPVLVAQLPGKLPAEFVAYEGMGCDECKGMGYIGRMLLFELLVMNDPVREVVLRKGSAAEIQKVAQTSRMIPLLHDGLVKVHQGETSLVELLRVVSAA